MNHEKAWESLPLLNLIHLLMWQTEQRVNSDLRDVVDDVWRDSGRPEFLSDFNGSAGGGLPHRNHQNITGAHRRLTDRDREMRRDAAHLKPGITAAETHCFLQTGHSRADLIQSDAGADRWRDRPGHIRPAKLLDLWQKTEHASRLGKHVDEPIRRFPEWSRFSSRSVALNSRWRCMLQKQPYSACLQILTHLNLQ